jgi:hypothetical protein
MKNIYIVVNDRHHDYLEVIAVCEDGAVVCGHVCSNSEWINHDMGITSTKKHEYYDRHCGVGNWKLEYVPNIQEHEELKRIRDAGLRLVDI